MDERDIAGEETEFIRFIEIDGHRGWRERDSREWERERDWGEAKSVLCKEIDRLRGGGVKRERERERESGKQNPYFLER